MNHFEQNGFYVSEKKVKRYLLNTDHPDGGNKAKFFINCGFQLSAWRIFAEVLCEQAENNPVKTIVDTSYGTKYVIDGVIDTLTHKKVSIRTVWIKKTNEQRHKLITAYPIKDDRII
jgi:hypothetical protein